MYIYRHTLVGLEYSHYIPGVASLGFPFKSFERKERQFDLRSLGERQQHEEPGLRLASRETCLRHVCLSMRAAVKWQLHLFRVEGFGLRVAGLEHSACTCQLD